MQDHQRCHGDGPTRRRKALSIRCCFKASISVALSEADGGPWYHRLRHMSEKGMKVMLSKDELSGLKSVELDFCEDCVYGKQKRVSFNVRKTPKAEKLELVHTDVWGKTSVPFLGAHCIL